MADAVHECREVTITVRPPEAGVGEVFEWIEQVIDNLLVRWDGIRGDRPFARHRLHLEVQDVGIARVRISGTIQAL